MNSNTYFVSHVSAIVKSIPGEDHPQVIAVYSTFEKAQSEFDNYFSNLEGFRVTEFIVR